VRVIAADIILLSLWILKKFTRRIIELEYPYISRQVFVDAVQFKVQIRIVSEDPLYKGFQKTFFKQTLTLGALKGQCCHNVEADGRVLFGPPVKSIDYVVRLPESQRCGKVDGITDPRNHLINNFFFVLHKTGDLAFHKILILADTYNLPGLDQGMPGTVR
jgi:hypothetical protein